MLCLKLVQKQEQANPKTNREEIIKIKIKIRAEINEIETKKYKELMKQKVACLKK
jgi:hypothetical protein